MALPLGVLQQSVWDASILSINFCKFLSK